MTRAALTVLAVWVALPAQGQEFKRTTARSEGEELRCVTWNERAFTYHLTREHGGRANATAELAAIDAAFATWQALADTCSDFTFTRGEAVASFAVGQGSPQDNLVVFRGSDCAQVVHEDDPCWDDGSCSAAFGCWSHGSDIIGLTTVTYAKRTGVALDADIELNAASFVFTTVASPPCDGTTLDGCVAYDVQNTVTHEIGHAVGFDHVTAARSTMAPTAPVGETSKRIIDLGTANGFCTTYPRGQPPVPCDEQLVASRHLKASTTGTLGCQAAGSPPPVIWVPWMAGFLLWAMRRPTRRLTEVRGRLQGDARCSRFC